MTSRSEDDRGVVNTLAAFLDRAPEQWREAGAAILVAEGGLSAGIECVGDPALPWYHLTKLMLGLGHHPSDLMWAVVVVSREAEADRTDNDARS